MVDQIEEDIDTLFRHLRTSGPLPLADVRNIAAPILRKWLIEGRIDWLANQTGTRIEFPAFDTKDVVSIIDADRDFVFYTAGGVSVDGKILQSVYVHNRPPPEKPLLPPMKEILCKQNTLMERKSTFFQGQWIRNLDIVKYVANKIGGVHIDINTASSQYLALEGAREYVGFGSFATLEADRTSQVHIVLSDNTPKKWDCVHIEMLSMAQSFILLHVDGKPLAEFQEVDGSAEVSPPQRG